MKSQIIQGNNIDVLRTFPDNHFDSIVTDPPYGIAFLGKDWDSRKATETTSKIAQLHNLPSGMKHTSLADDLEFQYWMRDVFAECMRVLKPGGHLLAFSAARTYHHMAMAAQTAGFEIRDQIMWIYSSGFPKSQDIGRSIQRSLGVKETKKNPTASKATFNNVLSEAQDKQRDNTTDDCKAGSAKQIVCTDPEAQAWSGWGTQLKPAHEPIVLARKPIRLSIAKNCQQWGVGALNIDAARVPYESQEDIETYLNNKKGPMERSTASDGEGIGMFEGKVGYKTIKREVSVEEDLPEQGRFPSNVIGEIADYQKYFYCPKVSRRERHVGYEEMPEPMFGNVQGAYGPDGNRMAVGFDNRGVETLKEAVESVGGTYKTNEAILPGVGMIKDHGIRAEVEKIRKAQGITTANVGNNHPTVKPIELMKYLIRLVTPKGGRVLDPFNGSGSTGCAAVELDYEYTGIELDERYVEIAEKRIAAWYHATHNTTFTEVFEIEH